LNLAYQSQVYNYQFNTNSMLGSTYLNYQPLQHMYMSNQMPYSGYSVNPRMPSAQLYMGNNVNALKMSSGMTFHTPIQANAANFISSQIQISTSTKQITQYLSTNTTTQNTTTLDSKKFLFKKDATIFLPKSMRKEGEEKLWESKVSENLEMASETPKNEEPAIIEKEPAVIETVTVENEYTIELPT
jgi:hypothetical protein